MTDQPRGGYGTGDGTLVDIAGNPTTAPAVSDTRPTEPYWKDEQTLVIPESDGYQREWFVPREVTAALRAESSAALQEARERMAEAAAHIESLLGHTVGERGEMVLYAADINALGARARQLRAALSAQEEGRA